MTTEEEAIDENTPPERLEQISQQSIEMARWVAINYAAPPELLTKLYQLEDSEVQKALVLNPNTPTEILMALGENYPQELLNNPVWDLLLLENPNLYAEIPEETLLSLLDIKEFCLHWGEFM